MTCQECGSVMGMPEVIPDYRHLPIGIGGVVLRNSVIEMRCVGCDEREIIVPNMTGLVAAVAVTRIKRAVKLDGEEIRFLRRALELNGRELADRLEVTPETVSRWENGKEPIGPTNEKVLRLLVGVLLGPSAPLVPFDPKQVITMKINPVRPTEPLEMRFAAVASDEEATGEPDDHKVWVKAA